MTTNDWDSKSFLFATWEGGGNVAPALTLARQLRECGHHVRFMCDVSVEDWALSKGLEFRSWRRAPNRPNRDPATCPIRDWEATRPGEEMQRLMDKIMVGPALDYALDLFEELDREAVDVVVASEMLLGVMAGCESRKQKYVVLSANLCFYPFPGMPSFGPGFPPPRDEGERALHAVIREQAIEMFDSGLSPLNKARRELGLAPLAQAWQQCLSAEQFLLGTSRAFDFPVEILPPQIHYVGPLLDEPTWVEPWQPRLRDARPLVAVCFSTTFQDHARVLQKIIDAAAPLPVQVVLTRGLIPSEDLEPAQNTEILANAPHNEVMRQATVVVTHGGHGTVMRGLIHDRPLLIVPHGRDQPENAVRVTERGAGLKLEANASVEDFRASLWRLLSERRFSERAAKLGGAIRQGEGDVSAVDLVEALANSSRICEPLAG